MKPLLWCSIASFSKKLRNVLVEGETKLNLKNLGGGGIGFKQIYKFKVSTLDNNKGFIKLHFLQKMNSQNTEWDHARFSSLV